MNTIKQLVNDPNTLIVDVRSPWEFDMEHIPGAMNIPLEDIYGKSGDLKAINKPVVLYCRSGNRSGMAVQLLRQSGLTDIYNGGGLTDMQSLLN
ncbi:MAG: rhodanese-like domain-containing protein [Chitinophagaceae bacterium]